MLSNAENFGKKTCTTSKKETSEKFLEKYSSCLLYKLKCDEQKTEHKREFIKKPWSLIKQVFIVFFFIIHKKTMYFYIVKLTKTKTIISARI